MSVERVVRKDGSVAHRVRWREGGQNKSRTFDRRRDAEDFDAAIRLRKRAGGVMAISAGDQELADFVADWWTVHAEPNLRRSTLEQYAMLLDVHILPRLGGLRLREFTPELVARFRVDLERAGAGRVSIAKSLTLLHGIFERACEWGRLQANPARSVRKPSQARQRSVVPLAPETVEAIRSKLLERGRIRDAALVSVLAYEGLRPGEALALAVDRLRDRTIVVDAAASLGTIEDTKTTGSVRSVGLVRQVATDLAEYRLASGVRSGLLFPGVDGKPWTKEIWGNWRRRIYQPVARELGLESARPYDLRHSFVSLLIHEGRSVVEVAAQAGHSPTVCLRTYAHVFAEFNPAHRITAEERIRLARDRQERLAI